MTAEGQARSRLWRRSRFHVFGAILMLLIAVLMAACFLEWMEENTADAKLNKIKSGMSTKEVQDILGPPAQGPLGERPAPGPVLWNFPGDGVAYVYFDSDGKATSKGWWEHTSNSNGSLMDVIRNWLGL